MILDFGAIGRDKRVWEKRREEERGRKNQILKEGGMRERQRVFVERKRKLKSWRGSEEMKKVKRNKKRKKWLVTIGEK